MKLMTRGEFIAANISGTTVTAEQYLEIYDVVRCLCDKECPGWKSELKKEVEPDYLKSSNNWYLPEEAKKGLVYYHVPPTSSKAWVCLKCYVVFWTSKKRREHRGHTVKFIQIEPETAKFLRGEPSRIKVITGTIE